MRFHYDKKEDAFSIRFNENPYAQSDEIQEGIIFDFDAKGKIIGIEILNASRKLPSKFKSEIRGHRMPLQMTVTLRK